MEKQIIFSIVFIYFELIYGSRNISFEKQRIILALENETISMECSTAEPVVYCVFISPDGERFSDFIENRTEYDENRCLFTINATRANSGLWKCQVGKKATELETAQINVRIVDHVAALEQKINVIYGKPFTILCLTTENIIPIQYCQFQPPEGESFKINPRMNPNNLLAQRYYYPPALSFARGECAVSVFEAIYEDAGLWKCSVGIDIENEYTDVIEVKVEVSSTVYLTYLIAFIVFAGFLCLAILYGGVIELWRNWRESQGTDSRPETPQVREELELQSLRGIGAQPDSSPRPHRPRTDEPSATDASRSKRD